MAGSSRSPPKRARCRRTDRRPDRRGQDQGRDRAQGPAGWQGLGRRREDRLHRRVDRAAGRRPWLDPGQDDSQADEAFLAALFAAEVNTPTAVIEGEDGIFRIGRVTEIAPETVDSAYNDKLVNDGIDLAKYREVVRGDVIRQKLEDKIVADAHQARPAARHVGDLPVTGDADLPADAVKVRHILYSPKDDPAKAQGGEIPADDPAWTKAKADADAAYAKLQADPEPVRRDRPGRERRAERPGPGRHRRQVLALRRPRTASSSSAFSDPILAAKA